MRYLLLHDPFCSFESTGNKKWIKLFYLLHIVVCLLSISFNGVTCISDDSISEKDNNIHDGNPNHEIDIEVIDDVYDDAIKDAWDRMSGPWLQQFEQTAISEVEGVQHMQGDDPGGGGVKKPFRFAPYIDPPIKCPSIPETTNMLACIPPTCNTNDECIHPFHLCCNNGCKSTCIRAVSDSVVLDWEIQPIPIDAEKGDAWLIHDEPTAAEDDIDDRREYLEQQPCYFEEQVYQDNTVFFFQDDPCVCHNGEVSCSVYNDHD